MPQPPRVLVIMDIACVGRAGLGTAMCVIASCGVQPCPLPSALYATHLGGFGAVVTAESAPFAQKSLAQYLREGVSFDGIYTGYLTGDAQFAVAHAAFDAWPEALKITDPVMADNGRLYSKTTPGAVAAMAALAARADVITPNPTEAALLLGLAPDAAVDGMAAAQRLAKGRAVVLTSAGSAEGPCVALCEAGGAPSAIPYSAVPQGYPGTGDLFTSALTGLLLRGCTLAAAAGTASRFVAEAARTTYESGGEVRHGVWYEPLLHTLDGEIMP